MTVITSIDFDHEAHLGTTLAAIAGEKAGIVKPGVPVVVGALCRLAALDVVRAGRLHRPRAAHGAPTMPSMSRRGTRGTA